MPVLDILTLQLTDLFRIGLVVALVVTALRTRTVTGTALPLALGVGFIALMIPMTLGGPAGEPLWRLAAVGLLANLVILAVVLAGWTLVQRWRS